jgi:hypothetical protein
MDRPWIGATSTNTQARSLIFMALSLSLAAFAASSAARVCLEECQRAKRLRTKEAIEISRVVTAIHGVYHDGNGG